MPGRVSWPRGEQIYDAAGGGILASDRCQFYDAAGGHPGLGDSFRQGGHPGLGDSFRQGGYPDKGRDKNITKLGWVTGLGD